MIRQELKKSRLRKLAYLIFSGYWMLNTLTCSADTLDLGQYRGKVVYMDFWATWCHPCLKSFPWMAEMETKFSGKNFVIVTVNVDTDTKAAHEFLKKHPLKGQTVFDTGNAIARQFDIRAMPTSFIFNAKGEMVEKYSGFNAKKGKLVEEKISKLLN